MNHERADVEQGQDADLLARTRNGDQRAYAELWQRYSQIAGAVARTYWWSADPDDLVAESFTRIYQAIKVGKGPTSAFKPYLFATMRNLAISWGRSRREIPLEHIEAVEDPASTEAAADADFDASLVSTAILALPDRWQEVLWFAEIENLSMQEIGNRLEITERAAAVLAFRAREGLRQAWIVAHLASRPPASKECRWTLGKLGAHARRRLTSRDSERVQAHLAQCTDCRAKADEARQASSRMLSVLIPAGIALGAGAQGWELLASAGSSANAAVMPTTVTVPVVGLASAKVGVIMLSVAAATTLAVGVSTAVVNNAPMVEATSAAEEDLRQRAPALSPLPTLVPDTDPTPAPPPAASPPEQAPVTSAAPEQPQSPVAPAPPPQSRVPAAPVIISIPAQVPRTEWISASVRCEVGADLTVTVYGVTIAAGTCASDAVWYASLDVSSYPVPSGTAISVSFVQSNVAGVSGAASAEVIIVD